MPPTDDRDARAGDEVRIGPMRVAADPADAGGAGQPLVGDGGVPEAGGVDLQPDVERIHRAIRREPSDPVEGREPVPWYFLLVVGVAFFWGGWYLGHHGGTFDTTTHIAFAARQTGIAGEAASLSASQVSDPVAAGEATYQKNCSSCHQATGKGVTGAFPPVVGSEWVTGPSETLVRILLHGLQGPVQVAGVTYNGAMPAWKDVLKDEEIAAVATYIRQWAPNAAPAVPPAEVTALRDAHADRGAAWTADELRAAVGTAPTTAPAGAAGAPGAAAGGTSTPPGQAGPQDRGVPAAGPGKGAPGVQGNAPGSPAGQPQDGRRGS